MFWIVLQPLIVFGLVTGDKDPDCRPNGPVRLWGILFQTHQVRQETLRTTIYVSAFRNLGVNEVRLASAFLNGYFPLWVRRIHFVNQPKYVLHVIFVI